MIQIENVGYKYKSLHVLDNFSCSLVPGHITCVLGPSGCGKTTLIHLIAGILPVQRGRISGLQPETPAVIFHETRLLPWKTLEDNIKLVLPRNLNRQERQSLTKNLLDMVNLHDFAHYMPHKLSGGMRQRGAMARAFALPSSLLLMDEPFKALDPVIKINLMTIFRHLWERDRRTVLFVTHNLQEATLLGDTILVLSPRPASLIECIKNPVHRSERKPYTSDILFLEKELFKAIRNI